MTLEQAMAASMKNSAIRHPLSGGSVIVDGRATRRNPHYNEDNYWVQKQFAILRDHYSTLKEVKSAVSDYDDWQSYEGE